MGNTDYKFGSSGHISEESKIEANEKVVIDVNFGNFERKQAQQELEESKNFDNIEESKFEDGGELFKSAVDDQS